jgi:AmmeMemoRadiSam system protein A
MEQERLNEEERKELLSLSRKTLETYYETGKIFTYSPINVRLKNLYLGCFVTLKKKGNLRGCLGNFTSKDPLYLNIQRMTISSAKEDPRFEPVKKSELKDIHIEISVIYPMIEIKSLDEIQVGRDGLYIEYGFYRGVLLPQVATEYGWDKEEFLSHTCVKAGLPKDAWRNMELRIFRFEADVFGEKEYF